MHVSSISTTIKRTFNLGNYESMTPEARAAVECNEGDDMSAAHDLVLAELEAQLSQAWKKFRPKKEDGA